MNSSDCMQSPSKIQGLHPSRMISSPLTGTITFGDAFEKRFRFEGGLGGDLGPRFWGITYVEVSGVRVLISVGVHSSTGVIACLIRVSSLLVSS